jgi:hypothetical protein
MFCIMINLAILFSYFLVHNHQLEGRKDIFL